MKKDFTVYGILLGAVILALVYNLIFLDKVDAKRLHPEKYYQEIWCNTENGQMEVVLEDKSRVDCLTNTHAVEVDFAKKKFEGIGQALNYGRLTGKRSGLLLIVEKESDKKHVKIATDLIQFYCLPIDVWTVKGKP